jgi:hypothetical protein
MVLRLLSSSSGELKKGFEARLGSVIGNVRSTTQPMTPRGTGAFGRRPFFSPPARGRDVKRFSAADSGVRHTPFKPDKEIANRFNPERRAIFLYFARRSH